MKSGFYEDFWGLCYLGVVLFLIGAIPVVGLGTILRRSVGLSWAWSLAISHAAIVLACVALYPTGIFFPDIPFDDLYMSYFFVPGLHIYYPATALANGCWDWLRTFLTGPQTSVCCLVFLPGFIGLLAGTIQWFLLGWAYQQVRRS